MSAAAGLHSRVQRAVAVARDALGAGLPEEVPHGHDDAWRLAQQLCASALCAVVSVLHCCGLSASALLRLRRWRSEGRCVVLRWRAEERCAFLREVSQSVASAQRRVVHRDAQLLRSDAVVTAVSSFEWSFEWHWRLFAFAGAAEADCLELASNRSSHGISTSTRHPPPRPLVVVRDPLDLDVSFLLDCIRVDGVVAVAIDRADPSCRTPRRNPRVVAVFRFLSEVEAWADGVSRHLRDVFAVQAIDVGSAADADSVLSPVVPLLALRWPFVPAEGVEGALLLTCAVGEASLVVDPRPLLLEHAASLRARMDVVGASFPAIVVEEARLLVACSAMQTLQCDFAAGTQYLEELVRKQLVALIGGFVSASDFSAYMDYHNARVFRPEFAPTPFCYAIRRPGCSPEGVLSLEGSFGDGAMPEPVSTFSSAVKEASWSFALPSGAGRVSLTGGVRVHGLVLHQFERPLRALSLSLRARQFGSFLVLLGRIAGPGLFEPQFGMIVRNKDDVTIPLDVETIPSAAEFKAATVSISSKQQAFAKMYRGMQLASTLFAVCVIQIKPQLEKVLRLEDGALTRQVELAQTLLELVGRYQISSDLLFHSGSGDSVSSVRRNARRVWLMIEMAKIQERLSKLDEEEKAETRRLAVCLHEYAASNDTDGADALLKLGVSVDARDELGATPLHTACANGARRMMIFLVERGASVNARDAAQSTPLHVLILKRMVHLAIWLIKHGADMHLRNGAGRSALELARPEDQRQLRAAKDVDEDILEQDALLDEMAEGLDRLQHIATQIGTEVDSSTAMIRRVGARVDRVVAQNSRVGRVLRDPGPKLAVREKTVEPERKRQEQEVQVQKQREKTVEPEQKREEQEVQVPKQQQTAREKTVEPERKKVEQAVQVPKQREKTVETERKRQEPVQEPQQQQRQQQILGGKERLTAAPTDGRIVAGRVATNDVGRASSRAAGVVEPSGKKQSAEASKILLGARVGRVAQSQEPRFGKAPRSEPFQTSITRLAAERAELLNRAALMAAEQGQTDVADFVSVAPARDEASAEAPTVDLTMLPTRLDSELERLDAEGSLRPNVISAGKTWSKRSQAGLVAPTVSSELAVNEQKLEREACFDLLDTLTQSGGLALTEAAVHIVLSATHCFSRNVLDTLVRDNVNPIAKVEHSSDIVASLIHGLDAAAMKY